LRPTGRPASGERRRRGCQTRACGRRARRPCARDCIRSGGQRQTRGRWTEGDGRSARRGTGWRAWRSDAPRLPSRLCQIGLGGHAREARSHGDATIGAAEGPGPAGRRTPGSGLGGTGRRGWTDRVVRPADPPISADQISAMAAASQMMAERILTELEGGQMRYASVAGAKRLHLTVIGQEGSPAVHRPGSGCSGAGHLRPARRWIPEVLRC